MGIDPDKWLQIVRGLAEHNAAVRVNLSSAPMEEGGRCTRLRVFEVGDDNVTIIEEPKLTDLGEQLREGMEVDVLAVAGEQRLLARCVVAAQVLHRLNETTRVGAVSLSAPIKVSTGQLRDFFRAPIGAGVEINPVQLRLDSNDQATIERAVKAEIDPQAVHKARLVNISGGGVGVAMLVGRELIPVFDLDTTCHIHIEMSTIEKPLDLRGQVVHTHKMDNGDLYVGFAFIFDNPIYQKHIEDQLQRLSVWLQRQSLKKNER